jgi:hypothetical protein
MTTYHLIFRAIRPFALLYAFGLLPSCHDGATGKPLGANCERDTDCEKSLICEYERCRAECQRDTDCGSGVCVPSQTDSNKSACIFEKCQVDHDCPLDLYCQFDRTCRQTNIGVGDRGGSGGSGANGISDGTTGAGGRTSQFATGGSGGSMGTDICSRQCATSSAVGCSAQPPVPTCVANCNSARATSPRSACLSEDRAFRECFILSPIVCKDGEAVIANKCASEATALQNCISAQTGGGTCSDTCFSANNGECEDCSIGSTANFCKIGTDCTDCGKRQATDACLDPDCGQCENDRCIDTYDACIRSQDCRELTSCIDDCDTDDTSCIADCTDQWPDGLSILSVYSTCLEDNCSSFCS